MDDIIYRKYSGEPGRVIYNIFRGGLSLASISDVADIRNRGDLRMNRISTSDAFFYDTKGNVKVVLDSDYLKSMNLSSKLVDGALMTGELEFKSLEGDNVFYIPSEEKLNYESFNEELWTFVMRGRERLDEYIEMSLPIMKKRFGANGLVMGVNFGRYSKRYCKVRPIDFGGFGKWSSLLGVGDTGAGSRKSFVGIAGKN